MLICGIDPGISGALALLDNGRVVDVRDMPVSVMVRNDSKIRRRVDPAALAVLLRQWQPDLCVIESVHASPGMGVSSAFTFGHTAGSIDAVVAVLGLQARGAGPHAWKRALGVTPDKRATKERATVLLGRDDLWPLVRDHGKAEAALLALYGHWVVTGNPAAIAPPREPASEALAVS